MDHQTGRLVHDDQSFVLVEDCELDRFRFETPDVRRFRGRDPLTRPHPLRSGNRAAVDLDTTGDEVRRLGTAQPEQHRDRPVETGALQIGGHLQLYLVRHA
jgi:hypothetical protein